MYPINGTADAIVNNLPVKFQKKRKFPDIDQHKLDHFSVKIQLEYLFQVYPETAQRDNVKSSYQMMNEDLFVDERMVDRNYNLKNIQKTNPKVLPPAGKNFYGFRNKRKFIRAQK